MFKSVIVQHSCQYLGYKQFLGLKFWFFFGKLHNICHVEMFFKDAIW